MDLTIDADNGILTIGDRDILNQEDVIITCEDDYGVEVDSE